MYEEIKHSIRIGDVLRKYGFNTYDRDSYRIPCPIHGGRDSNFSVSEREGLWNCFSVCGRGGSVIDLVAALENISIADAVRKLREDFRLTPIQASTMVAKEYKNKNERFATLFPQGYTEPDFEIPELSQLEEGYRGLRAGTIYHWGLARTQDGVYIPLLNSRGQTCSFTIRRDDGRPKYDNARGTSKCFPFGLYENRQEIINQGFAWIVEAQLDAVKIWQEGYRNVIALMGSSMTEQQAMLLLAATSTLKIVFDGDDPGRNGARKLRDKWNNVFDIDIIDIPDGKDPDELTKDELVGFLG